MISEQKRILINTVALYGRLGISTIIALYTSRVVLQQLGFEDFGISSIIFSTIAIFLILNGAMAQSTQRFLTFALGQNDIGKVAKIYSMAQTVYICLAGIFLVFAETIGIWLINYKLDIPAGRLYSANAAYQIAVISGVVTIIFNPLDSLLIAYERFQFYAVINIVDSFLRLGGVLFLYWIPSEKLIYYVALNFVVIGIGIIVKMFYCKSKICSVSRYRPERNAVLFTEIFSFSFWNFLEEITTIINRQIIIFAINIVWGVAVNAAMGIAEQVANAIGGFVTNFQLAFSPALTKNYASNNIKGLDILLTMTSKLSVFLLMLFVLPVVFNINFILQLWLGDFPQYTAVLINTSLLTCFFSALSYPVVIAAKATGNIKHYQIYVNGILLLNLPLCLLVMHFIKYPVVPILTYTLVVAISVIWRVFYLKKLIPTFQSKHFFFEVCVRSLLALIFALASYYICLNWIFSPLGKLLSSIGLMAILTPLIGYWIIFNSLERKFFKLRFKRIIRKYIVKKNKGSAR